MVSQLLHSVLPGCKKSLGDSVLASCSLRSCTSDFPHAMLRFLHCGGTGNKSKRSGIRSWVSALHFCSEKITGSSIATELYECVGPSCSFLAGPLSSSISIPKVVTIRCGAHVPILLPEEIDRSSVLMCSVESPVTTSSVQN